MVANPVHETLRFRKVIRAPRRFVYAWCTDFREDDDRLTNDLYHYRARILLHEPARVVRVITLPGPDRNRNTDVEVISLFPPDRWRLRKMSVTDDEIGSYRLDRLGARSTRLRMVFRRVWKAGRAPDRARYRELFNRVWDRYVAEIESEYRRSGDRAISAARRSPRARRRRARPPITRGAGVGPRGPRRSGTRSRTPVRGR